MRPALATVAVLSFITAWNEFILALVFVRSPSVATLPLGLQAFFYQFSVNWPPLFAALTSSVLPVVIVYVLMQRHVISGLTAGAVKN
jgi:raffinose/stachyose/melibiose transport system permease protein